MQVKNHNMNNKIIYILSLSFILFYSCQSQTPKKLTVKSADKNQQLPSTQPNFNYYVETPENWSMVDTVMENGMRIKLLKAPITLLLDSPFVNILIAYMQGDNIDDFFASNITYLKSNTQGIVILEKGEIDSTVYNGKWFTYSVEQNGMSRDKINYMIPVDGFAYMITCQTSKGKMNNYRRIFDKIAKSFKG